MNQDYYINYLNNLQQEELSLVIKICSILEKNDDPIDNAIKILELLKLQENIK